MDTSAVTEDSADETMGVLALQMPCHAQGLVCNVASLTYTPSELLGHEGLHSGSKGFGMDVSTT